MIKNRNKKKTENTFSVLQEEDAEPLAEEKKNTPKCQNR